eukprot:3305245-Pyramimonas_sp.AAC.1
MIHVVQGFIGKLLSWAEGCLCHDWLKPVDCKKRGKDLELTEGASLLLAERARNGRKDGDCDGCTFTCPMHGKRAPELARGCFAKLVEQVAVFL